MGYDEPRKVITLADDEITLLKEVLEVRKGKCVSIGETITVETLLEKLSENDDDCVSLSNNVEVNFDTEEVPEWFWN